MELSDYVKYDAVGLAQLITSEQISAQEVQQQEFPWTDRSPRVVAAR
jgi:hypothetical protein